MNFSSLNIKRFEKLFDRRLGKTILTHDILEPLAVWSTPLRVVSNELGIVVVNFALAHSDQRSTARLVTGIVVQANFTQG